MKQILWVLGIVLAFLIIITVAAGIFIGPIVKAGIEDFGPRVTGVTVSLDSVGLSPVAGSVELSNLAVGNPQGYSSVQAFSAGTISVAVDPMSLNSKKIVVRSVHVLSPQIDFEGSLSGNNLTKIQNNVNTFMKQYAPASNGAGSPNAANNTPAKIEVDDFLITGAKASVNIEGLGAKQVPLPDIHLTDLGKGTDGLTPQELTSAILGAIITDTVQAVTSSAGSLGKSLGSIGKSSLNDITSSISGLFGK